MSQRLITAPIVQVNNNTIGIDPNSFTYTEGLGEAIVRTQSTGGLGTANAVGINVESLKGTVKFTMSPTAEHQQLIREWKTNLDGNVIRVSDQKSNFTRTFQRAVLIIDPESGLSADGNVPTEWESLPAV